jgi:AraC-like DNA-binding protein
LRPSPPGGHIGDDGVNCSRVPQPMIVARVSNPLVRKALCFAAHVEEDVVLDARLSGEALQRGFPRLLVRDGATAQATRLPGIPVVDLTDLQLARWEIERRADELPLPRLDFLTRRLKGVIAASADGPSWVDKALGDLSRAAGARLPLPLRAFARRVLEFPIYYRTLHSVAKGCGLSRGALKARFRRRGLESPYTYLRWLRLIAVAQLLSDRTVTVAAAASRLGFTSDGNLCRMMASLTRLTPTEARSVHGWNTLLISFAWQHLSPEALDAWAGLGDMFVRRVA